MELLPLGVFVVFFAAILVGNVLTWRLDWILLQQRPELHREWQLGMLWTVWWSPTINRRLRALEDVRITRLLDQMKIVSIFLVTMFGALMIVAVFNELMG